MWFDGKVIVPSEDVVKYRVLPIILPFKILEPVVKFFDKVRYLGTVSIKIREGKKKEYKLWLLEGYKE